MDKMTVKIFEEKILKGDLAMVAPDVEIEGRGIVIISSGSNLLGQVFSLSRSVKHFIVCSTIDERQLQLYLFKPKGFINKSQIF